MELPIACTKLLVQPAQFQCLQYGPSKQVTREADDMNVVYMLGVERLDLTF